VRRRSGRISQHITPLQSSLRTGETEETAQGHAQEVVAACEAVHGCVMALFDGIEMPSSSVWLWPGGGGGGK
jgi:hypothetical protein